MIRWVVGRQGGYLALIYQSTSLMIIKVVAALEVVCWIYIQTIQRARKLRIGRCVVLVGLHVSTKSNGAMFVVVQVGL